MVAQLRREDGWRALVLKEESVTFEGTQSVEPARRCVVVGQERLASPRSIRPAYESEHKRSAAPDRHDAYECNLTEPRRHDWPTSRRGDPGEISRCVQHDIERGRKRHVEIGVRSRVACREGVVWNAAEPELFGPKCAPGR